MRVAIKFGGKESDVRKLVAIFEAIIGSDAFSEVEIVDFYEEEEDAKD